MEERCNRNRQDTADISEVINKVREEEEGDTVNSITFEKDPPEMRYVFVLDKFVEMLCVMLMILALIV